MVTTTKYVWDPVFDCVTHELDENNAVKAVYHNEPQQYGGVLSQRRGNTSHYHHHDALGSTRFLTDSSGNVTDTYLNDAWANSVASTGTTVNPFKWVGKYGYYTDNSTAQVYIRARMYQPTVARWESYDPVYLDHHTGYRLVTNRPINAVDPSGLWEMLLHSEVYWVARSGDTFEQLVEELNRRHMIRLNPQKNKVCIRPVSGAHASAYYGMSQSFFDPDPADWARKLPTPCAVYDVENLLPKRHKGEFFASIGEDSNGYIQNAGGFFSAEHFETDTQLFKRMKAKSEAGKYPLQKVVFVGHSWTSQNLIGSSPVGAGIGTLNITDFAAYQKIYIPGLEEHIGLFDWQTDLHRAMNSEFALPCWFAVDAEVTMAGCITWSYAHHFARVVLRNGGSYARGTLKPTWYNINPLRMGWGNDDATAAADDPDYQTTPKKYFESKNWVKYEGKS